MANRAALRRLLTTVRYEVIPSATVEERVRASVPVGVTVTVTASPTKGLEPTLALTERLAAAGYRVVPHLSARLVMDRAHLADIVGRLRQVGITGYPETHPAIDDDVAVQAMWDKRRYATYIVSNLCFDPWTLAGWVARIRRRKVTLPVHIGLAGPVDRTKLLAMATKIGVGESTRFLTRHPSWFARFALPGGYAPESLLRKTIGALRPDAGVIGLHVFTFNQLAETEAWRQACLARAA